MPRIAIIDDDVYIGDLLAEILQREGYQILRAYSGTEALYLLQQQPDLVLLDLMLPGLSGEEVLPHLQGLPVIILSAKTEIQGKIDLLLGGAADYVTKPFDTGELLARIAVQLRRTASGSDGILLAGELRLDQNAHQLSVQGKPVRLTKTEYAILALLMQNPGQVLARSVILERISSETLDCT